MVTMGTHVQNVIINMPQTIGAKIPVCTTNFTTTLLVGSTVHVHTKINSTTTMLIITG